MFSPAYFTHRQPANGQRAVLLQPNNSTQICAFESNVLRHAKLHTSRGQPNCYDRLAMPESSISALSIGPRVLPCQLPVHVRQGRNSGASISSGCGKLGRVLTLWPGSQLDLPVGRIYNALWGQDCPRASTARASARLLSEYLWVCWRFSSCGSSLTLLTFFVVWLVWFLKNPCVCVCILCNICHGRYLSCLSIVWLV